MQPDMSDAVEFEGRAPDIKRLAVRAHGQLIEWTEEFREAMVQLCAARDLPAAIPERLLSAIIRSHGILLLWPGASGETGGSPVLAATRSRPISTHLASAFHGLKVELPQGVAIAVPVNRCQSQHYGACLALHFGLAEFLPEKSQATAVGLLVDEE